MRRFASKAVLRGLVMFYLLSMSGRAWANPYPIFSLQDQWWLVVLLLLMIALPIWALVRLNTAWRNSRQRRQHRADSRRGGDERRESAGVEDQP